MKPFAAMRLRGGGANKTLHLDGTVPSGLPHNTIAALPSDATIWTGAANITASTDKPYTSNPYGLLSDLRSISFNGSSNNLYSTNASLIDALKFGSSNFTIRAWLKPTGSPASARLLEFNGGSGIAWSDWLIWCNSAGTKFLFQATTSGAGFEVGGGGASDEWGTIVSGVWTFVEVCRIGNFWYCFQDGVLLKTFNVSGTIPNRNIGFTMGQLFNTTFGTGTITNRYNGLMTGVEVYNGFGMWSATHAVPSAPQMP